MNGQPLKADLERILGRKIEIQNDANCFAMAEALYGASKGRKLVFGVVGEKFIAQSGASFFIAVVRAAEIGFGLGPDGDGLVHRRDSRIWRKTSRHGSPKPMRCRMPCAVPPYPREGSRR